MICPKCNKEVKRLDALSRFANEQICSKCSSKEAFEVLLRAGRITQAEYDTLCKEVTEGVSR